MANTNKINFNFFLNDHSTLNSIQKCIIFIEVD